MPEYEHFATYRSILRQYSPDRLSLIPKGVVVTTIFLELFCKKARHSRRKSEYFWQHVHYGTVGASLRSRFDGVLQLPERKNQP